MSAGMKYRIRHTTHYKYSNMVSMCFNEARMSPLNNTHQTCARNRFVIHPVPDSVQHRFDYFGNRVTSFDILQTHREMSVTVHSEVQVIDQSKRKLKRGAEPWDKFVEAFRASTDPENLMLREYTLPSPLIPLFPDVAAYARESFPAGRPLQEALQNLMHRIFTDFKYDPGFTSISTPLKSVLAHRRGVCQDFAHFGIACARAMGLPAVYVSGYLETLPPPGEEKLEGADASHAWYAVHLLEDGWVHYDPTNDMIPAEQHITVALGRDFADVSPLKGVIYGGDKNELKVSVDVSRLDTR